MKKSKRILIASESIYLAAIEAVLHQIPGFEIIRGNLAGAAESPPPDTIIIATNGNLMPALAFIETYPSTPVIALDEQTHTLTLLSSNRIVAHTTQDLLDVIMR